MSYILSSCTPPPRGDGLWIRRLAAGEQAEVIALAKTLRGYRLHWNGRRTVPCTYPIDECNGCKRSQPTKWRAYLHCYHMVEQRPEILEITESTWQKLGTLPALDHDLRGQRFTFRRSAAKRGSITVTSATPYYDLGGLPKERDLLPILQKFWFGPAGGRTPAGIVLPLDSKPWDQKVS